MQLVQNIAIVASTQLRRRRQKSFLWMKRLMTSRDHVIALLR